MFDPLFPHLSALVRPDSGVEKHSSLASFPLQHHSWCFGITHAFRGPPPRLYYLYEKGYFVLPEIERDCGQGAFSLHDLDGTIGWGIKRESSAVFHRVK